MNYESILPQLKTINNGKSLPLEFWIAGVGEYDKAIGYLSVFWPEFHFVEDCVFLSNISYGVSALTNEEKMRLERQQNHRHLCDLFINSNATNEIIKYLGDMMKTLLEAKLKTEFPNDSFKVVFEPFEDITVDNPSITFYKVR